MQVCHNLDSIFARNPGMKMISISQNDGNFTNCHCEKCTEVETEEGSASGPIIRFLNRLGLALPPTRSSLPSPTSIVCNRQDWSNRFPTSTSCSAALTPSARRPLTDNESGRDFVRALEGWSRISNNIFVWDYGINFDNMVHHSPTSMS